MSFAFDVKKEICQNRPFTVHHKKAQAYGLFLFGKAFSEENMSLHTENVLVAKLYSRLILDLVHINTSITTRQVIKKSGNVMYVVSIDSREDRDKILGYFSHNSGENISVMQNCFTEEGDLFAFISGAFLACGNLTDPQKDYHLEFSISQEPLAVALQEMLVEMGVSVKRTIRRTHTILYIKESEGIEDVLTMIGAVKASLSLMDVKILKEVRNKVNRVTNCETANIEKTVTAASVQIADIQYILDTVGMDGIPQPLKEIASLRLENPDMSLRDMGEMLTEPLSRSGVNHRLRKLSAIAAQLRSNKNR